MTNDDAVLAAFDDLSPTLSLSAVVADSQARAGIMHSSIKPAFACPKVVGRALTVRLSGGDLQDPLGALERLRPGDVVVVDAFGETETSVFGGLMGALFQLAGGRGAVIDGACRDTDENRELGFPVFSRAVTPRGTHTMFSGRSQDIEYGVPISCGGVLVHSGDIVVGDELGVVVVPAADAERVVRLAKEQADREEATRARIRGGASVADLLAEFGRI